MRLFLCSTIATFLAAAALFGATSALASGVPFELLARAANSAEGFGKLSRIIENQKDRNALLLFLSRVRVRAGLSDEEVLEGSESPAGARVVLSKALAAARSDESLQAEARKFLGVRLHFNDLVEKVLHQSEEAARLPARGTMAVSGPFDIDRVVNSGAGKWELSETPPGPPPANPPAVPAQITLMQNSRDPAYPSISPGHGFAEPPFSAEVLGVTSLLTQPVWSAEPSQLWFNQEFLLQDVGQEDGHSGFYIRDRISGRVQTLEVEGAVTAAEVMNWGGEAYVATKLPSGEAVISQIDLAAGKVAKRWKIGGRLGGFNETIRAIDVKGGEAYFMLEDSDVWASGIRWCKVASLNLAQDEADPGGVAIGLPYLTSAFYAGGIHMAADGKLYTSFGKRHSSSDPKHDEIVVLEPSVTDGIVRRYELPGEPVQEALNYMTTVGHLLIYSHSPAGAIYVLDEKGVFFEKIDLSREHPGQTVAGLRAVSEDTVEVLLNEPAQTVLIKISSRGGADPTH